MKSITRFILVTAGAALMAVNLNTFVHTANLLPGGFSGITLLVQQIFETFLHIKIPFSLFYWLLNIIPAILCFKYVGKKFTLLSLWMVIASGLLTDLIPGFFVTDDILLCTIFGGIIQGLSIWLCLYAGATSGGSDFVSIYISEKTGQNAWSYIFIGNCVVLIIYGFLFGWKYALYSIIFQFADTQVLNTLYKRYQKSTLLIVTDTPDELIKVIYNTTSHDATLFQAKGAYKGTERKVLYTVVSSDEETKLLRAIKECDPDAFINVLQTKTLNGRFFMKKND